MKNFFKMGITGIITGLANGLFGAGGGTIAVPFMQRLLKIEAHKSHATAIAIILPLSVISMIVYLWGKPVDWVNVLYISAGGAVGGFVGAKLLTKIPNKWLHRIFGLFIIAAAVRMFFK